MAYLWKYGYIVHEDPTSKYISYYRSAEFKVIVATLKPNLVVLVTGYLAHLLNLLMMNVRLKFKKEDMYDSHIFRMV